MLEVARKNLPLLVQADDFACHSAREYLTP
jgi:hypothetical protein